MPPELQQRIEASAGAGNRSAWIREACEQRLVRDIGAIVDRSIAAQAGALSHNPDMIEQFRDALGGELEAKGGAKLGSGRF